MPGLGGEAELHPSRLLPLEPISWRGRKIPSTKHQLPAKKKFKMCKKKNEKKEKSRKKTRRRQRNRSVFGLGFQGLHHHSPPCATALPQLHPPHVANCARPPGTPSGREMKAERKPSNRRQKENLPRRRASRSHRSCASLARAPLGTTSLLFPRVQIKKKGGNFAICHRSTALEKACVSFNPTPL